MIDWFSASSLQIGLANHLLHNCGLTFKRTKKGLLAKFKNIVFKIEPDNEVKISGSLHRLFNDGIHNWNDFKRLELYDTIHSFCDMFGIDPNQMNMHAFEWGVNISTPFDPSDLISRVLAYKIGTVQRVVKTEKAKDFLTISFYDYTIKLYNKGLKYGKGNLLRFEVHAKRMTNVGGIPELKMLSDLYKIPVLEKLGKRLISEFNGIIIAEPMQVDLMKPKELAHYQELKNLDWLNIEKLKRSRAKKKFNSLTAKYGNGLKKKASLLISQKWNELFEVEEIIASTTISKIDTFYGGASNDIDDDEVIKIDTFYGGASNDIDELKNTNVIPFTPLGIAVNSIINPITVNEKTEVLKECSNCKKILKIGVIKYCDLNCELQKKRRNKRSNPNHKTKAQLKKLAMQPTLFKQSNYLKIDQSKINWLQQQGFNLKSL